MGPCLARWQFQPPACELNHESSQRNADHCYTTMKHAIHQSPHLPCGSSTWKMWKMDLPHPPLAQTECPSTEHAHVAPQPNKPGLRRHDWQSDRFQQQKFKHGVQIQFNYHSDKQRHALTTIISAPSTLQSLCMVHVHSVKVGSPSTCSASSQFQPSPNK